MGSPGRDKSPHTHTTMSLAIRQQIAMLTAQASRMEAEEKAQAAAEAARVAEENVRVALRVARETAEAARQAAEALNVGTSKTSLTVFITADEVGLRKGHITIDDFKDMVAFSYQLKQDLSVPFNTLSQDEFIRHICRQTRADTGDGFTPSTARNIHNIMTRMNSLIGKMFVVAVAGSKGGGLEIRRVTGPYRYSESFVRREGAGGAYYHQFPTERVRKLTPEESREVAQRRPNCYSMLWDISIAI